MSQTADRLDEIIAHKRQELISWGPVSQSSLKPSTRDLCHSLSTQKTEIAILAEIKQATPFRGRIAPQNFDPLKQAQIYEENGAAAVSVLTDQHFFQGSWEDLQRISEQSALPVLCKEFVVDPRQIYRARAMGADAILLIVRVLSDEELRQFLDQAHALHMRALVEVHDEPELQRALKSQARLIGINNRNLRDGSIDLQTTFQLARHIPQELVTVAESGVETPEDIEKLRGVVDAVLVGTALMQALNPAEKLLKLVQAATKEK